MNHRKTDREVYFGASGVAALVLLSLLMGLVLDAQDQSSEAQGYLQRAAELEPDNAQYVIGFQTAAQNFPEQPASFTADGRAGAALAHQDGNNESSDSNTSQDVASWIAN